MKKALNTLLSEVLDYAGLFPPARLPLAEALRNYAAYLRGPHAWMLGRFVCPTTKFAEIDLLHSKLVSRGEPAWRFSGLGRGGETAGEFQGGFEEDLREAAALQNRLDRRVLVDAVETRVPASMLSAAPKEAAACVRCVVEAWDAFSSPGGGAPASLFLELPFSAGWQRDVPAFVHRISAVREDHPSLGLKIRTGGIEAHQFPPVEQVACFIAACRDFRVPFKATAGLHHPFRHDAQEVCAKMHGFMNVLVAGILAVESALPAYRIADVLSDENTGSFSVDESALSWRGHRVALAGIRSARSSLAISFGSCSLDEPVADLTRIGWM